ncbi:hypothetical protein DVH24_008222 [Malus domestica]|uniref:KANL3/Tex30 alpha/beta hydrolase-like domain-containing protein n=1 Tax=Malus domestica TaxID=3750 RepID=A0A498JQ60_MALDO|nr:hypothetical protein DVH24_008222 [Malus domestica]
MASSPWWSLLMVHLRPHFVRTGESIPCGGLCSWCWCSLFFRLDDQVEEDVGKSTKCSRIVFLADISGGKKRAPPKAEKLVDFRGDVAKKAVAKYPGHPLILAGKPMGSRLYFFLVSCMVACKEDIHASAINCLGYPLKVRCSDVVPASYFVPSASKDGLCPLEKLETTLKKMKCPSDLHVIDGGDHSFKIGRTHLQTTGLSQDEAENLALQAIAAFWLRSLEGR